MSTMKDVARLAGVSVSTVSIVINNQTAERKIPKSTIDKVQQAIDKLDYRPNRNARQLRSTKTTQKEILFYWPLDQRASILASLLLNIQAALKKYHLNWRIIIETYQNDALDQSLTAVKKEDYDGVIIGATSKKDLYDLEKMTSLPPVILINRSSKTFSTVTVDPNTVAQQLITLFLATQTKHFSLVTSTSYLASGERIMAITDLAKQNQISVDHQYQATNTYQSGIEIAKTIAESQLFEPILVESDIVALGMTYYFNRHHVKIPEDLKLISLGMLDHDMTKYNTPAISTIEIPDQLIAESCIKLLMQTFKEPHHQYHATVEPLLNLRDSFPASNN